MKGSNDSMMLRGADAPALGASSLRSSTPRAGGAAAPRAPDPEGCGQADPAAVQRRIPVADPRGSRPLHPARRDWPSAASRGLVQLAFVRLAQGAPQRFAQGPDTKKNAAPSRPSPIL